MTRLKNIQIFTADHIAIRQLIEYYNDMVNNRNWEIIPQLFTRNAIWQAGAPINLKWEGLEGIRNALPKSVERMAVLIQSSSGIIIQVENDLIASATSLLTEFGRPLTNGEGMHAVGTYHDTVIKEDEEWKFQYRRLELIYFDTLPVPGTISGYKY